MMTQVDKNRLIWNSVFLIAMALLPILSALIAGVIIGKRAFWGPSLAWTGILILVLYRMCEKTPQNGLATKRDFDVPLVTCIVAGALIGFLFTLGPGIQAGIRASTPGPFPPPGDTVTEVTSTYSVFGVVVGESTGPSGASSQLRFTQFVSSVRLVFVTLGIVSGLVVYLIGFRRRGGDDEEKNSSNQEIIHHPIGEQL